MPLSTHLAPLPASVSPSPLASAPHFQLWAMGQAMAVMVFVMASYRIRERGRTRWAGALKRSAARATWYSGACFCGAC